MPPSPFDDPFADLFDQLPDPRTRDVRATETRAPATASPLGEGDAAPLSRRAAREAAARRADETEAAPARPPVPVPPAGDGSDDDPFRTGFSPHPDAASPAPRRGSRADPSLEDLFASAGVADEQEDQRVQKRRRGRRRGGWIALGIVLVLLGGTAAAGWYVWSTYERQIRQVMGWQEPAEWDAGIATGEALVTITEGELPPDISRALFEANVTRTADAFYDMLIRTGQNPTFFPGVYRLQQKMTSEAALAALQDPANKLENTAQLPEGLTVGQSLPLLADGTGIPLADFEAAVADPSVYGVPVDPAIAAAGGNSLEGWLFPATYTFEPGATATDVIQTLVDRTIQSLDAAGVPAADRERILTIASIIQREARYEADMKKVSTVIENRMNPDNTETNGYLQMDSTAQYGFGELDAGTASTSEGAQYDDNPWNTYVRPGLPVGPIANPGDVAIAAAMSPEPGPWLYFVTVNLDTGETIFTTTYAEHQQYVEQMQQWCSQNPDSGC